MRIKPKIGTGHLSKLVHVLEILSKSETLTLKEAEERLESDEYILRSHAKPILQMALDSDWLILNSESKVIIAPEVSPVVGLDRVAFKRELLWLFIVRWDPQWSRRFHRGIAGAKRAITDGSVSQVFRELGLFCELEDISPEIYDWWARARARSRRLEDERLQANHQLTGDEGERLTMQWEYQRTGKMPRHMAMDSDSHGYDVASMWSREDDRDIRIEVKSTSSSPTWARVHLSRKEAEVCAQDPASYRFHFWDLSNPIAHLLEISGTSVLAHVPVNQLEGRWEEVTIPFNTFDWDRAIDIERSESAS